MTPQDFHKFVKESIREQLKESRIDLESLHNGVSSSTITGKIWFKLISSLESLIDEVNDFKSQYSSTLHGPLPNITTAQQKLEQVILLLSETKPIILGMDDIEKRDLQELEVDSMEGKLNGGSHPHARYSQQAGATPFDAPGDEAINENL